MSREWKRFGLVLGAGILAVFLYEIADLIRHLLAADHAGDRAAVWSVLFMMAAIFLAVGGIGIGLARTIARERRSSGGEGARPPPPPPPPPASGHERKRP